MKHSFESIHKVVSHFLKKYETESNIPNLRCEMEKFCIIRNPYVVAIYLIQGEMESYSKTFCFSMLVVEIKKK